MLLLKNLKKYSKQKLDNNYFDLWNELCKIMSRNVLMYWLQLCSMQNFQLIRSIININNIDYINY